jgi:hypothetical protein
MSVAAFNDSKSTGKDWIRRGLVMTEAGRRQAGEGNPGCPTHEVFETDHGPVRVDEMDREELLKVIACLKEQNAQLKTLAEYRFELLIEHWEAGATACRGGKG